MLFAFEKTPLINLPCKLVPVQYREYEYYDLSCGQPLAHCVVTDKM